MDIKESIAETKGNLNWSMKDGKYCNKCGVCCVRLQKAKCIRCSDHCFRNIFQDCRGCKYDS